MLRLKRLAIDTWHENVAYIHRACVAHRAEEYLGPNRVEVRGRHRHLLATLNVVEDAALVAADELGLSPHAFRRLGLAEGEPVALARAPEPASIGALRSKVAGQELAADDIDAIVQDMVDDRYTGREIAGFLISAARAVSDAEVAALARAHAGHAARIEWDDDIVVDKHSMGGVPGNRVTMIVVPIVAAHGLAIPKASSRAITSAAGTADAMETLARVELDADELRRTVIAARGCMVWNGLLNHSPVDDVMNAVTRPLGIDSHRLSVASILSKKLAAGATHVLIDVPVGPTAKLRSDAVARETAALFETIGAGLGLTVVARITDGTRPIGRGVGPALEARDAMQVLRRAAEAPADLRRKAIAFAGRILEFDPAVADGAGEARATRLLDDGSALAAMERIVDLQGRRSEPVGPGALRYEVVAPSAGTVAAIDGWRIAGIARRAGAPADKGAGLDLLKTIGDTAQAGEPLYRIHAGAASDLTAAIAAAQERSGFTIAEDG